MHFCTKDPNNHKPDGRGDLDHVHTHPLNVSDGAVMMVGGFVVTLNPGGACDGNGRRRGAKCGRGGPLDALFVSRGISRR